jgi:hypothetical protein
MDRLFVGVQALACAWVVLVRNFGFSRGIGKPPEVGTTNKDKLKLELQQRQRQAEA